MTRKQYQNMRAEQVERMVDEFNEWIPADEAVYPMYDFDSIMEGKSPWDVATMVIHGGNYGHSNDKFSLSPDYFTFDGYGNLVSIEAHYLAEYFEDRLSDADYFDEDEEEEA